MTPSLIDGGAITLACMHAVYRSVNIGAKKFSLHLELTDLTMKNLVPFGFPNGTLHLFYFDWVVQAVCHLLTKEGFA